MLDISNGSEHKGIDIGDIHPIPVQCAPDIYYLAFSHVRRPGVGNVRHYFDPTEADFRQYADRIDQAEPSESVRAERKLHFSIFQIEPG
jgi:hypothetical protein